jgi:hypothetical protein
MGVIGVHGSIGSSRLLFDSLAVNRLMYTLSVNLAQPVSGEAMIVPGLVIVYMHAHSVHIAARAYCIAVLGLIIIIISARVVCWADLHTGHRQGWHVQETRSLPPATRLKRR